jgi:hypothetical protein
MAGRPSTGSGTGLVPVRRAGDRALMFFDDESPAVLRRTMIAAGYRDDEVRRMCRRREAVALRPGAYLAAGDRRLQRAEDRHRLLVHAALEQLGGDAVVSHVSAAVLHGLDVWAIPLGRAHLSRPGTSGGRRTRFLHRHAERLDADQLEVVDGVVVTSVAETVCALARTVPFEQAVVVADGALHRAKVTAAALAAAVARAAGRPGVGAAERVIAFADGRAESPGESRSRVAIRRAGLPVPVLQLPLRSARGARLGLADFGWPDHGVVGEFDGLEKYGRLVRPGRSAADVLVAEKRREDAMRDAGLRVVRWIWDEIAPFDAVAARLRRALQLP